MEKTGYDMDRSYEFGPEEEINLLDLWLVIWKRRKMIALIMTVSVFATVIISLFMTNIYKSAAVIMPVTSKGGGSSGLAALAQQFGGLADMAGIATPGQSSPMEIVGLLKSNILREKMITQYNLMPILFYEKWDETKKAWKKEGGGFKLNPLKYLSRIANKGIPGQSGNRLKADPDIPSTWDALRLFDDIVKISNVEVTNNDPQGMNVKENSITIAVEFHDPEVAAKLVEYFLETLMNHMSGEAKRVATTNRKYLEEQLATISDPFIRQKTYAMVAQQIETAMMSEVKENFAFKVIDPPIAPDKKIKPKRAQMVVRSFVVALFIGIFVAFFLEYIEKIRKEQAGEPAHIKNGSK